MDREFLWMTLPCYAAGAEPQGGTPTPEPTGESPKPPAEGTQHQPAKEEPKGEGEGEAPKPAEGPKPNGSLIPEAEGAPAPKEELKPEEPKALDFSKIKLPEGMSVEDPGLKALAETLGNAELSPEARIEALLGQHREALVSVGTAAQQAVHDNYRKVNDGWINEIKTDPTLGGTNFQATISTIAKGIDQWAPDAKAFREALAITGAGNNPAVIRTLYSLTKALAEGGPAQGAVPHGKKTAQEIFYGNQADGNAAA